MNYGEVLAAIGVNLPRYDDSRSLNGPPSGPQADTHSSSHTLFLRNDATFLNMLMQRFEEKQAHAEGAPAPARSCKSVNVNPLGSYWRHKEPEL